MARVKTREQQSVLMLHRSRAILIRQKTMAVNALRGHLAEFGMVARQGSKGFWELVERIFSEDADDTLLPSAARIALGALTNQIRHLQTAIKRIEVELLAWHRTSEASRRLETIPGIGFITATAIAATITDPAHFTSSRQFAAWLGLTPKPHSSGGKERLGGVSKMGNKYLRTLLVARRRSDIAHPIRAWQRHRECGLDQSAFGQETGTAGLGGTGQQDGSDRLGSARQERDLSSAGDDHRRMSTRLAPS